MTPGRLIPLRRVPLVLACRSLQPADLQILLALVLAACPRTGRVWTTPLRLAEEFSVAPALVDAALDALVRHGHITLWSRSTSTLALRCYELGPVFLRRDDRAPANLPVEADP